MVLRAQPHC